jgi:hypothetical protein
MSLRLRNILTLSQEKRTISRRDYLGQQQGEIMADCSVTCAELGVPGNAKLVDDPDQAFGWILVGIIQDSQHKCVRRTRNSQTGQSEETWNNVPRTRFLMRLDEESTVHQAERGKEIAESYSNQLEGEVREARGRSDSLAEQLAAIEKTSGQQAKALTAAVAGQDAQLERNRKLETRLGQQRRDLGRVKTALGELRFNELVAAKA